MKTATEYLDATSSYLDSSWQDWVRANIDKGVSINTIANTLLKHGFRGASYALLSAHSDKKMPYISLDSNQITLGDKTCQVVFTCHSPFVVVIDDFLSAEECQALIGLSENKFKDARVVDSSTGDFVQHKARTSMNAAFIRGETDLINTIENRIAELIHWEAEKGEPIQVLRYEIGGEYKAHYDYFDPNTVGGQKNIGKSGQRVGTFLMYLSDVDAGGATRFPSLNFEVRPKAGMALYFADLLPTGEPDTLSLHSSVPVVAGTKYLATKWLRENAYYN